MWEIWEFCKQNYYYYFIWSKCSGTTIFAEDYLDSKTLILYFKINSGKVYLNLVLQFSELKNSKESSSGMAIKMLKLNKYYI